MNTLEEFKNIFWDAFHRPKLETEKYLTLWSGLESLNDLIAGPLYGVYTNGHCDYIFNDKQRFPQINDIDDFLDYCTDIIKKYHEEILGATPLNDEEKKDKQVLLYQVDMKMELARLAYEIQKNRINLPDKE